MCIRDRYEGFLDLDRQTGRVRLTAVAIDEDSGEVVAYSELCLLYTSDAADERSSVDLGGRRIIKKKNQVRA